MQDLWHHQARTEYLVLLSRIKQVICKHSNNQSFDFLYLSLYPSQYIISLLVAILVPILVFCLAILPCLWFLLRLRRRKTRNKRFMTTFEDMTQVSQHPYRYSARAPYAETLTTIDESDNQSSFVSIPSARRVHADMMSGRSRSASEAVYNPFADPSEEDSSQSLLASRGLPRWYGTARGGSRATSPAGESSSSASIAPSNRWGAMSPSSLLSRSASRLAGFVSVPLRAESRAESRAGVESLASQSGHGFSSDTFNSDSDWELMEDPFADPNKRSSTRPLPHVSEVPSARVAAGKGGVVYSSLLPKLSTRMNK